MAENKYSNQVMVEANDDIDIRRIFGELIDNRWLIIGLTSLFICIALLYIQLSTPVYQADALIQVEQNPGSELIKDLTQVLPSGEPQSSTEIELIQSRMILGETVDELNLQNLVEIDALPFWGKLTSYFSASNPKLIISRFSVPDNLLGTKLSLEIIDNNTYILDTPNGKIEGKKGVPLVQNGMILLINEYDANPKMKFAITKLSRLSAINNIASKLTIEDKGKDTGILTLTLTGTDPIQISTILDTISKNYLKQNIERKSAEAEKSLQFINTQLPEIRQSLDSAEDKLNAYRQQKDSVDLPLEAKSVLDSMVSVDAQLNELTFKEAEISKLYTKDHPAYRALLEKRQTLEDEKEKLNKRISAMPKTQQEIVRLTRDVNSNQEVYMQLSDKQQELRVNRASIIGNVRIIDRAVTQPIPIAPRKMIILAISIILGLIISVAYVLMKMLFHKGIEDPEQLESLGITVYATIPFSEWQRKKDFDKKKENILLAIDNATDLAVEAIRSLRTSLHFAMLDAKNNIISITGASPSIGKSFISSNLAAIIAQSGKKILLIDADMRLGALHETIRCKNEYGLSDILTGANTNQVIQYTEIKGLDFIPRGPIPPNPSELLMHSNFSKFLDEIKTQYDLIIIDTPPVLAVTDAVIISSQAGTTLIVARYETNTPKEITLCIRKLEQNGVLVKGVIINAVVKKAASAYSYGYYHYEYGKPTK